MAVTRVRDLPLFWKLLLPFLGLIVLFGSLGAFLIVRNLSVRAQDALDQDLARRSFEARSIARDRELYLVESANFATNIQGMADAVGRSDRAAVETLLGSVLALKTDVTLLVATDDLGVGIVELRRTAGREPASSGGGQWAANRFVADALRSKAATRRAGVIRDGGVPMLVIAAPICEAADGCTVRGVAIVGIGIERLADDAAGKSALANDDRGGAAVYDGKGRLLAGAGLTGGTAAPAPPRDSRLLRRTHEVGGVEVATLYSPFEVQGQRVGTLAATVATRGAYSSVRGTAWRLGAVVFLVMVGVIGVGAALSRFILAQLQPLVATNRALGRGELTARAPVVSEDELGELARGVNLMADQLQASYESLELRVAQRTEEVRRLLQERTEFFAAISHDLRTPLAVIRSQAGMLLDPKYTLAPAEAAETIVASSNQLLSLINDLLDLARAEAGRLDIDLETVRLHDVVGDLRRTIDGLALAGEHTLTVDVPKKLPAVQADPRRLREILLNLVDNAVKYTPTGGAIAISAAALEGDTVAILVCDNGTGIPEGAREKIFEPFYRVKGNSPQRGQASTGLGLALTQRFVEAQGGELSFHANPEGGTTFRFTLRTAPASRARRRTRQTTDA